MQITQSLHLVQNSQQKQGILLYIYVLYICIHSVNHLLTVLYSFHEESISKLFSYLIWQNQSLPCESKTDLSKHRGCHHGCMTDTASKLEALCPDAK